MQRFKNILFVTNNETGEVSIRRAVELAVRNEAKLTLLDVVEKIPTWAGGRSDRAKWDKIHQADIESREHRLERAAKAYRSKVAVETKVLEGKKFLETIRQVLKHGYDLVVKDTAISVGLIPRVFATEDMHLLRKCPCPILLTKYDSKSNFSNIMAAVDFDDLNDLESPSANNTLNKQILDMSISLAQSQHSNLDVIHAYQIIGENMLHSGQTGMSDYDINEYIEDERRNHEGILSKLLGRVRRRLGEEMYCAVNIKMHVIKGNAEIIIPRQAKQLDTDLIVMGTVGRTGVPGFFIGNTAETILNNIDCSVLALKPKGFVSPVTLV